MLKKGQDASVTRSRSQVAKSDNHLIAETDSIAPYFAKRGRAVKKTGISGFSDHAVGQVDATKLYRDLGITGTVSLSTQAQLGP
jgi:hypothetical protein